MSSFPVREKSVSRVWLAVALFVTVMSYGAVVVRADDDTGKDLQLLSPLNGSTVRETVAVKMSPASFPQTGYLSITIDGNFIKATAFPAPGSSVVYSWDTKAPYILSDDASQTKHYVADGPHTITITVLNRDNTVYGTATSKFNVSNSIAVLKDGVKLIYRFPVGSELQYHRTTTLNELSPSSGVDPTLLQTSDVKFTRTIEDVADAGDVILVDKVDDNGIITTGTTPAYVQSAYQLHAKSRIVSTSGVTIRNSAPVFPAGSHFYFSVPNFPGRRVQIGDSWETNIQVSLQWGAEHPTDLRGTARLDSFEWQDGYPCAKIIETYNGPATLNIDGSQASQTGQAPTTIDPVQGANINLTRTVWFGYSSGRLVHLSMDMQADTNMYSAQLDALTAGTTPQQAAQAPENAGANPFMPDQGVNGAGNFGNAPGASVNTGQARAQISFHVTEEMAIVKNQD